MREAYTADVASAHSSLQQHGEALHGLREENAILKEILASRGINYESELQRRKRERPAGSFAGSSTGSQSAGLQSSGAPPLFTTPPTTISSPGGSGGDHFELSPGNGPGYQHGGFHVSHGSEQPGHMDLSPKADNTPVQTEVPGIFEKDPQLGIDFVLTYVESRLNVNKTRTNKPTVSKDRVVCTRNIFAEGLHQFRKKMICHSRATR